LSSKSRKSATLKRRVNTINRHFRCGANFERDLIFRNGKCGIGSRTVGKRCDQRRAYSAVHDPKTAREFATVRNGIVAAPQWARGGPRGDRFHPGSVRLRSPVVAGFDRGRQKFSGGSGGGAAEPTSETTAASRSVFAVVGAKRRFRYKIITLKKVEREQSVFVENKILEEQQLILTDKEATINNGYLQIVGSENIYVEKQAVTKMINNRYVNVTQSFATSEKSEDEKRGSDGDQRTSRKSLPHKKRISRKLKKQNVIKIQCNLCEQTFTSSDDFAQHEILCQTTITPVHNTAFSCQICNANFQDQLRFFEHLKSHYEPNHVTPSQVEKVEVDTEKDNIFSTLLNLTCIQCNKTFRRQKAFETHMKEIHHKEELNEFSETEDLMEGINVVVDHDANSDNDTKAWWLLIVKIFSCSFPDIHNRESGI
jgi:hypothetical protein